MRLFFTLLLGALVAGTSHAQSLDQILSAADAAKANASRFSLDRGAVEGVVERGAKTEDAKRAAEIIRSPEFTQKVDKERARLQQEVFGMKEQPSTYYTDLNAEKRPCLAADERVYLFVSSSMPEATIRTYVKDIARLHDPNIIVIMRGFIGGMDKFQPTMEFITNMQKENRTCTGSDCAMYGVAFEIDPNLYRRFKPAQVPALIYTRGVTVQGEGSEGFDAAGSNVPTNPWWVIYGDSSLSYLFSRVSDASGSAVLADFSEILN